MGYPAGSDAPTVLRSETPLRITASRAPAISVQPSQNNTCPDGSRPREIGRFDARAEQSLGSADALKGAHDVQRQRDEPFVIDIGQFALGLRPDELIRIELRRIAGKAMRLHPGMAAEKGLNVSTPMDSPAVPQQDDLSSEMTEQLTEKRDDLGARDVPHVEVKVQPEAPAPRGHGEGRDNGHSVPAVAMPKARRVPHGRPGLADVGDEQEAALIEECEMGASARGVFLSGAIHPASTGRWPARHAGARGAPASASSIRGRAATAPRRRPGYSGHKIACG